MDPVESLSGLDFDYVLLATLDRPLIERTRQRLTDEGIPAEKILTVVEDIDRHRKVREYLNRK